MKPSLSMTHDTPCKNLHRGNFIFACPSDLEVYFIWMGKAHNNVVKDGNDKHYNFILIFSRKNTTMNNTITISDVNGSCTRTNIGVINEINHI